MAERKGKRFRPHSSSEEEEYDNVEFNDSEIEDEEDDDHDNDTDYGDDDKYAEESDDEEEHNIDDNDGSIYNRVIRLVEEGRKLSTLKLNECKIYLRKHGLRITGTKSICIDRIKEHWRLKDGGADELFPSSSFIIDCTGDVCTGDVVQFLQKVYKKFDKVTRHGRFLGKRTIVGRVVKESYGAAKQQHTFTVEVLWSRGVKKLPLLFPLLVKGRNLYKMKTFRQRWSNETQRLEVLAEKHNRGTAARLMREKKKPKKWNANKGSKNHNKFHSGRPPQTKNTTESKRSVFDRMGKSTSFESADCDTYCQGQESSLVRQRNVPQNAMSEAKYFEGHQNTYFSTGKFRNHQSYGNPQMNEQYHMNFQQRNRPLPFSRNDVAFTSTVPPSAFGQSHLANHAYFSQSNVVMPFQEWRCTDIHRR